MTNDKAQMTIEEPMKNTKYPKSVSAKQKAVVLLSGGLDSAVTLYYARDKGYECRCLTFDYGQRHRREIAAAFQLTKSAGVVIQVIELPFLPKGSSLLDPELEMPAGRTAEDIRNSSEIPNTYVPARNTVFLSLAASYAEAVGASRIFIGAHHEDSSGYPDCRREYLEAFNRVLELGTRAGIEKRLSLEFPLLDKAKKDIIRLGLELGVPFEHAWSCYSGGEKPCRECDSCVLRAKGFKEAGIDDPFFGNK